MHKAQHLDCEFMRNYVGGVTEALLCVPGYTFRDVTLYSRVLAFL